jgi:hypothetical protein
MKRVWLTLAFILSTTPLWAASATLQGSWLHTPDSNYSDSAGLNARLEAPLYRDLSIAGEFGYHGEQSHGGAGSISGYHLLPELIYYPSFGWKIRPYLLGGWGWSFWNFDKSQDTKDRQIEVNLGNSFAQKYGVGANYPLGHDWFLNIEWSYFHSFIPREAHYSYGGNSIILTDGSTIGQEETNFTIGLGYQW